MKFWLVGKGGLVCIGKRWIYAQECYWGFLWFLTEGKPNVCTSAKLMHGCILVTMCTRFGYILGSDKRWKA